MGHIMVWATFDEGEVEGMTRYTFDLHSGANTKRKFIIDVPHKADGSTDVWVDDSTVQVGDTPEDGFATFTPVEQSIKTHIEENREPRNKVFNESTGGSD